MLRFGGILIGLCIFVIAVSLGIVLYIQMQLPLIDAGLVSAVAAVLMLVLQNMASRRRERSELEATVEELRRANMQSRDEIDRLGGQVRSLDGVGVRITNLEDQVESGFLAALDARIADEVAAAKASLVTEMKIIETLVKQLAENVAPVESGGEAFQGAYDSEAPQSEYAEEEYEAEIEAEAYEPVPAEDYEEAEPSVETGAEEAGEPEAEAEPDVDVHGRREPRFEEPPAAQQEEPEAAEEAEPEEEPEPEEEEARPDTPLGHLSDANVLDLVRQAIHDNRVDVYLQPIVKLPQRKAHYYEALTRLRNDDGELILPVDYLRVAEPAGIMPMIDNLLLFRGVQIVRRLAQRNRDIGIFCNISAHTLVDPDFFPQFLEYLQHNSELAGSIVFEFPQSIVDTGGPMEMESLNALREQGFRFSLDHVTNLNLNPGKLAELGFRFVKIDASQLLEGSGSDIHPADLGDLLQRYGIELIAEKIENERSVIELLEFNVAYGQGYLFSEPRPVKGELLQERKAESPIRKAV